MCRSLGLDWRGPKLGICMYATAVQCWLRRLVRGCLSFASGLLPFPVAVVTLITAAITIVIVTFHFSADQ